MALFPKEGTNLQPRQNIQSPKKKKAIFHPIDFLSPPTAIRYFHLGQTHLALTFSPQHEDGETTTGRPGFFRENSKHATKEWVENMGFCWQMKLKGSSLLIYFGTSLYKEKVQRMGLPKKTRHNRKCEVALVGNTKLSKTNY